jgi:hypothetical protein
MEHVKRIASVLQLAVSAYLIRRYLISTFQLPMHAWIFAIFSSIFFDCDRAHVPSIPRINKIVILYNNKSLYRSHIVPSTIVPG